MTKPYKGKKKNFICEKERDHEKRKLKTGLPVKRKL